MAYASKIVLDLPISDEQALRPFVEACLRDRVSLIAVVGDGASRVEDLIDELVVGNGSDTGRYITTTMHPDETVEHAMQFAANWESELGGAVQLVRL